MSAPAWCGSSPPRKKNEEREEHAEEGEAEEAEGEAEQGLEEVEEAEEVVLPAASRPPALKTMAVPFAFS